MVASGISLDEVDHHLLAELQRDAGRTLRDLGEVVGLSPSAVQRRITRYRRAGILARQVAVLEPGVTPGVVLGICLVTMERHSRRHNAAFRRRLLATPEVQQAYDVSGEWDYVVVLATWGMAHHTEVADRLFQGTPNVQRFVTLLVFDPIRIGTAVPTRPPG